MKKKNTQRLLHPSEADPAFKVEENADQATAVDEDALSTAEENVGERELWVGVVGEAEVEISSAPDVVQSCAGVCEFFFVVLCMYCFVVVFYIYLFIVLFCCFRCRFVVCCLYIYCLAVCIGVVLYVLVL